MKKLSYVLSTFLVILLIFAGCQKIVPTAPKPESTSAVTLSTPEQIAWQVINQTGWEVDQEALEQQGAASALQKQMLTACLPYYNRKPLGGGVVHYQFQVPTGPGPYDMIGIHRVVKEKRPFQPIKTAKTLFLQHGDAKDFEGMWIPGARSSHMPDDFGLATYLAKNNVDVWGISQAWTLVPAQVADHSFMADWGLQKQVDDLRLALAIAYITRTLTGCGWDKLNLLGYSSGVMTGYALLNEETQLPTRKRLVKGFIPADVPFKTDDELIKQAWQGEYVRTKTLIDNSQYGDWIPFTAIGTLARTDPEGESPLFPGFTNLQTAMFYSAGPIGGVIPFHYFAGIWENDFPVDLQYVTKDECFDFLIAGVPWEAARFIMEYSAVISDAEDLPFDDHLGAIEVPIFNVAPAGGFGESSKYTTALLASSDITHLIPSLHPPEDILKDFAHIDMFLAHNAETLVWQPILNWVEAHSWSVLAGSDNSNFLDGE